MTSSKHCTIKILDEVNCVLVGLHPDHVGYFSEEYAVYAPNHFFNPKFKLGQWDGRIHYFYKTGKTYVNLLDSIIPKVLGLGYKINLVDDRKSQPVTPPPVDKDFFSNVLNPKGEPWEMRDYQIEMVNALFEGGSGVGIAGTGAGKAQPLYSKILTPTGWTTIGEVCIGDIIITPKGTQSKIIGIYPQGDKNIYEITFHDGAKTHCCEDHLWKTYFPKQNHKAWTEERIVTTSQIIQFLDRKHSGNVHTPGNISIPLVSEIEMEPQQLIIEPYILGVLIGDGKLSSTVTISSKDSFIVDTIQTWAMNNELKCYSNNDCDYYITKQEKQNSCPPSPNALVEMLKTLQLYNTKSNTKFIPEQYKNGSIEQRWELVRGLMDTDGTADSRGNISFTTVSKQLGKDVQDIVRSLGALCTISSRIPTYTYLGNKLHGQIAYTCFIRHPTPKLFFKLQRKIDRCRNLHADGRIALTRRITSIKSVGVQQAQCIMIDDPDHLYITDDYIVTHNTSMCAALALSYERAANYRSLIVVPDKNLTNQTREEYGKFGLDVGEYSGTEKDFKHMHVVSTWQSLKNNPILIQDFQVIIVDECHGLKGNVLTKLLNEYGKDIPYRFGVTGTLPKETTDAMAVQVAVGPVRYTIPAHQLIEEGHLASLEIEIFQLEADLKFQYQQYLDEGYFADTKGKPRTYVQFKDSYLPDWQAEKNYLRNPGPRINWIANYIQQKRDLGKGNVLCLVDGVKFGQQLTELIPDAIFLYGKDKMKDRKEVYNRFKTESNLVVIATIQIASTGLDIPRIFYMMGIDLGKSFIRIIQSIGRGLRKAEDKDSVHFSDICGDLKYSKKHLRERIKYYQEAKYPYTKKSVDYGEQQKYNNLFT